MTHGKFQGFVDVCTPRSEKNFVFLKVKMGLLWPENKDFQGSQG